MRNVVLFCGAILAASCSQAPVELAIDLQTDLAPGIEFDEVRVTVDELQPRSLPVSILTRFEDTPRIAEYRDMAPGTHEVHVVLIGEDGAAAQTRLRVRLDRSALVRAIVTRSCLDIRCPNANPTATACFGGRCIDPSCDPNVVTPATSDASHADAGVADECRVEECTVAADCDATQTPPFCVTPVCQRGACLYLPTVPCERVDQYCDPGTDSCRDLPPTGDGPPNVVAIPSSSTAIDVSWNAVDGAAGYVVELAADATFAAAVRHTLLDGSSTTSSFDMLLQGHHYYARVRTVLTAAVSAWASAEATTPIDRPSAPGLSLAVPGTAIPYSSGNWIYVTGTSGNFFYVDVQASASCPAGAHAEYTYRAWYLGEASPRPTQVRWPAHVFTVSPNASSNVQVWASVECVIGSIRSPLSVETRRCIRRSGASC